MYHQSVVTKYGLQLMGFYGSCWVTELERWGCMLQRTRYISESVEKSGEGAMQHSAAR